MVKKVDKKKEDVVEAVVNEEKLVQTIDTTGDATELNHKAPITE